jgi:hypothetical protein
MCVEFLYCSATTIGNMETSHIRRFTGQCRSTSRQIQAWWWLNEPKHVVRNDECMACPYFPLWRRNNKEKDFEIFLGRHTRKYTHFTQIRLLFLTSPSGSNLLTSQPMCSGHRVCWQTSAESKSLNSRRYTSCACVLLRGEGWKEDQTDRMYLYLYKSF